MSDAPGNTPRGESKERETEEMRESLERERQQMDRELHEDAAKLENRPKPPWVSEDQVSAEGISNIQGVEERLDQLSRRIDDLEQKIGRLEKDRKADQSQQELPTEDS